MRKLYTLVEAAKACGKTSSGLIYQLNHCDAPLPDVTVGTRRLYSPVALSLLQAHFAQYDRLMNQQQMARALGIKVGILASLPAPSIHKGRRWYYTRDDVETLRTVLAEWSTRPRPSGHSGYYNTSEAAAHLGMPLITLQYWQNNGHVKKPSHRIGLIYCYSEAEVAQIRDLRADYFCKR